ncbi:lysylphosphatidylglycerol synthase domain-containing protein [Brachybacterium sp. AOP43-C2-M15]|uniref:lysylphosphatidylglycerol synthase domain-containing protein n=1 Tax=Brachybacterium sp. AOP43-C2-M15 TaxID=3457661 RepID=UPI0040348723
MDDATTAPVGGTRRAGAKRALRWIATLLVVGVVGWLFSRSLAENWDQVREQDLAFSWWWVLATVCFAVAVATTGIAWGRVVRWLDPAARIPAREAIAVQCLSWVLKYIPGQVGSVANKVLWAGRKGISRTLVLISFLYENVFLQIASLVPAAVILLISLGPQVFGANATLLLAPLLVLVPAAVVLYAPAFHALIALPAKKLLKAEVPRQYFLSGPRALLSSLEFLLPRAINGVGFVLLAATISDITPAQWLPFAATYALAGAIGILAILVPSGLGVREAVIVVVLSQYVPASEAIIISLLARLLATVGDAVVALLYLIIRQTLPKETRP